MLINLKKWSQPESKHVRALETNNIQKSKCQESKYVSRQNAIVSLNEVASTSSGPRTLGSVKQNATNQKANRHAYVAVNTGTLATGQHGHARWKPPSSS